MVFVFVICFFVLVEFEFKFVVYGIFWWFLKIWEGFYWSGVVLFWFGFDFIFVY